ncbi:hypothetical protein [Streptomyces sp. GC420]|nr:hypothetical protein [Streptomyces sp. GC420]
MNRCSALCGSDPARTNLVLEAEAGNREFAADEFLDRERSMSS